MNIDLLFTQSGEAGFISDSNFVKKVAGFVFDTVSGLLTLEYVDMDFIELNIPVEKEFYAVLDVCPQIHVGAIKDGHIAQAYQVPFVFLDDPYRAESLPVAGPVENPLQAFDYFVKACVFGQPVHREDLGDDQMAGCVLGDAMPSSLQFAPHLARRHAIESGLKAAPRGPQNVPRGPAGPSLGGGGGGSGMRAVVPPKNRDDS